jgi:hypothetical protein
MMNKEYLELKKIKPNEANPRDITEDKFIKLVNSLLSFPAMLELRPIVIDNANVILGGNQRYKALQFIAQMSFDELTERIATIKDFKKKKKDEKTKILSYWQDFLEQPKTPILKADTLTDEEKQRFIIEDNTDFGNWNWDCLANEWDNEDLQNWGLDVWNAEEHTEKEENKEIEEDEEEISLADRFIIPPFSIFDTRKGYWQERKKIWRKIIGDMGESRNDTLIISPEIKYKELYLKTKKDREKLGISFREYFDKYISKEEKERAENSILSKGVSLLDPVMAEIICCWFGQDKCKTFDCFAGDSVFGYVSSYIGNEFTGIEIRPEQCELNNKRVKGMSAKYINDDGQNVGKYIKKESQDLLFSCPPYFNLEKYSNLPNDASNQKNYDDFIAILNNAFSSAISCLKQDRFAVIVVGDIRDKQNGYYYDICGDIKNIFFKNGMKLYNEIILIETAASTALRAGRYMDNRKVAKMHQNILVFYNGNTKNINKNFKKIEYASEDLEFFTVDSRN